MPYYPPAGGNGTPGGSNTQVQFNDNSAFGGIANATWDKNGSVLTLVTPSVASFAQAQHSHQSGAGGGQLAGSSVFTMTGGQIKTSVLGTGTASPTTFLRGDNTWSATPSVGSLNTYTTLTPAQGAYTGATYNMNASTTAKITLFTLPAPMSVNAVSVEINNFTTAGSMRWGLYSVDGQTQLATALFSSVAAVGTRTVQLSSVFLNAGNYYQATVPLEGEYTLRATAVTAAPQLVGSVIGKTRYVGAASVAGGALPATFTPSTLPVNELTFPGFRLDN